MSDERIVPEMSHPTKSCPHPEKWHAIDDMATELEILAFLTALVVALKPLRIIETGCYHGNGTEALARGVIQNGFGHIRTCDMGNSEINLSLRRVARLHAEGLPGGVVEFCQCSGVDLIANLSHNVDLAFLDSGMDTPRMDELRALYPKLSPGGVVAIHDSGEQFGMREFHLGPLLRELDMQYIFFDTPRGLCLCRKKPEVYP